MKKNRKATFADYARLCRHYYNSGSCPQCLLNQLNNEISVNCAELVTNYEDKANDIIIKWCDKHPVKTRQSELLKIFPKARMDDGVIELCPDDFVMGFQNHADCVDCSQEECDACRKKFWLEEIE